MIIAVVLMTIPAMTFLVALAHLALTVREPGRAEKARIEREMYKAEFRLHEMASEALSALLDVARTSGFKQPKQPQ